MLPLPALLAPATLVAGRRRVLGPQARRTCRRPEALPGPFAPLAVPAWVPRRQGKGNGFSPGD